MIYNRSAYEEAAVAYITEKVSRCELLAQLAEEATELAHAALKLRRVLDGSNPTPKSSGEALNDLVEEVADVSLLIDLVGMDSFERDIQNIMRHKTMRWRNRLEVMKGEEQ